MSDRIKSQPVRARISFRSGLGYHRVWIDCATVGDRIATGKKKYVTVVESEHSGTEPYDVAACQCGNGDSVHCRCGTWQVIEGTAAQVAKAMLRYPFPATSERVDV